MGRVSKLAQLQYVVYFLLLFYSLFIPYSHIFSTTLGPEGDSFSHKRPYIIEIIRDGLPPVGIKLRKRMQNY